MQNSEEDQLNSIGLTMTEPTEEKTETPDEVKSVVITEPTNVTSDSDPSKYIIQEISETVWEDERKKYQAEIEKLQNQILEPPAKTEKPRPKKKKVAVKSKSKKSTRKSGDYDPVDIANRRFLMEELSNRRYGSASAMTVPDHDQRRFVAEPPLPPMPLPMPRYYPGDPRDPRNHRPEMNPAYYSGPPAYYDGRMYK